MIYKIQVEGGFTAIPREYEGEIAMSSMEKTELFDLMRNQPKPNLDLRDGYSYIITLIDGDDRLNARFDESTLPQAIRKMMGR